MTKSDANPATAIMRAPASPPISAGEIAAVLAEALEERDVFFAASDEAKAVAVRDALTAFMPAATIVFCPAPDTIPGENAPPSPANVGQRVAALRQVLLARQAAERCPVALITTGEATGRLYPPPEAFEAAPPRVSVGDRLELGDLFNALLAAGYVDDDRVDEPGEVALRGQVLDVYPADDPHPKRIEVSDGVVVSIRSYDPASQRTVAECEAQELGRVNEPPIGDAGIPLVGHLPDAVIVVEPGADDRRRRFLALVADARRRRPSRPAGATVDEATWGALVAEHDSLKLEPAGTQPQRFVEARSPLRAFSRFAKTEMSSGKRLALLGSARDIRFLRSRISQALNVELDDAASWGQIRAAPPGTAACLVAPISRGFERKDIAVVAAADLIGSRAQREVGPIDSAGASRLSLAEIRVGDLVVHEDHGIAVVKGIQPMPSSESEGDAIALQYADEGIRLVPISEADRLWRYGGERDAVRLDKLDGTTWQKRRAEIGTVIDDTANAMIALAEERASRSAPVLTPGPAAYERFVGNFPYTETSDQMRAIDAVRQDLASGTPMDRLIVGDVGFGKTEVALRAAAIAALAGFQVALAAPTTVLARQHLETFVDRFEGTGVEIAGLSRLTSPKEKKRVRAGLADGSIDIVIGTGAVAAKGMSFANLALTIIDEEQRFGTSDKERLRILGGGHTLTLSATPIPRTLQGALVGIQQLSIIATPPARRQPIRTSINVFDEQLVRSALMRERSRGGQSFVVVPRIEDMLPLAEKLAKLVPELDVLQAHGRMPAAEIDEAMVRFGRGDGDVLLATNIIEAGLDVPRANTMILHRADRFGLAQLHQLRGRVGRGSRRGQVFLLTEPDVRIATRTLKRLRTLEAFDRLGAGFEISSKDLDMRGAGDLLGEEQAGHMKLIGIDLYQHLLENAIRRARGEHVEEWRPELNLGVQGQLPQSWIPDDDLRLSFYVRIARAADAGAIDALEAELEDRFGIVPQEAAQLLAVARIRARALSAQIARIDAGPAAIAFTPRPGFRADAEDAGLVRKDDRLLLLERIENPATRLERIEHLLETLVDT